MKQCTVSMAVGAFVIYRSSDIYERWMLLAASTPPHLRDICSVFLCSSWCILKVGIVVIQRSHIWEFCDPCEWCFTFSVHLDNFAIEIYRSPSHPITYYIFLPFLFFLLDWESHDFPLSGEEACRKRFPFVFALRYCKKVINVNFTRKLKRAKAANLRFFCPDLFVDKMETLEKPFPGQRALSG